MAILPLNCATQCWHTYYRGLSLAALQPLPTTLPLPFSLLSILQVRFFLPLLPLRSRKVLSFSTWRMKTSLINDPSLLNLQHPQSPLIALDSVTHLVILICLRFSFTCRDEWDGLLGGEWQSTLMSLLRTLSLSSISRALSRFYFLFFRFLSCVSCEFFPLYNCRWGVCKNASEFLLGWDTGPRRNFLFVFVG